MGESALDYIYQQNDNLKEQRSFWRLMKSKERNEFIEEVEALVVVAKQLEERIESRSTKAQLQNIIEVWGDFLSNINDALSRELTVLSTSKKTSSALDATRISESETKKAITGTWGFPTHPISQVLSPHKVGRNSPLSTPHNPRYRAIIDKLNGTINSQGDIE